MRRILVFGVFDGLHNGHREFLREAKGRGEHLTAVVTRDEVVELLKKKKPLKGIAERMADVESEGIADLVVLGDEKIGSWAVIEKHKPDVVALGYDQVALKAALQKFFKETAIKIEIAVMKPHQPENYHSSILQKRSA